MLSLEDIARLLAGPGQRQYGREAVNQLGHALQCAALRRLGQVKGKATPPLAHYLQKTAQVAL